MSSVLTYSAVARVSRSASTRASGFDAGLATPILDTFSARHDATRRVRPLGIGHLALLAVATARHPGTPVPRYPRAALDPGTGTGTTDQPEHWRDTGKLRASISAPGLLARVYKCVTLPKSTGSKTG